MSLGLNKCKFNFKHFEILIAILANLVIYSILARMSKTLNQSSFISKKGSAPSVGYTLLQNRVEEIWDED